MSVVSDTKLQATEFILTGIHRLEGIHVWASAPICLMYVASFLGNSVILFILKTDPNLHEPMYIFLSMLANTDIDLSISTMPTTLGTFFFNSRKITHDACFAQRSSFSIRFIQSSMLLILSFDRFVAICKPLRYASILVLPRIAKMGLLSVLRGVVFIFPLPILLKQYQYCQTNILLHFYGLHKEVMMTACSDKRVGNIYGFFLAAFSLGLDLLLIFLSYVMILKMVFSILLHRKCVKALNTCVSHIFAILLSYIPGIGLSMIHRFVKSSSPLFPYVLGHDSFLILPLKNSTVYSVKAKPIRVRII